MIDIKIGDKIQDNDPRDGSLRGYGEVVFVGEHTAKVRWLSGRETVIGRRRIVGPGRSRGYSIVGAA